MHTKTKESQNVRESFYFGAVPGAKAWIIYAVVECFFTSILPWIINPSYAYIPVHRGFTLLLFIVYPVIGLLLGGLAGVGLYAATGQKRFPEKEQAAISDTLAAFTIVLAFDANLCYVLLFTDYPALNVLPSLGVSLLLFTGLAVSAKSYPLYRRLRFLTNPWTITVALFGIMPWVIYEPLVSQTKIVKGVSSLFYPCAVFLVSFFIYRIIDSRLVKSGEPVPASLFGTLALPVPVFLLVFGISMFLEQAPLRTDQNAALPVPDLSRPNVILITMDTVRADHLSLYGYERETTPNLDRLAEESTLYANAISSSDMTLASHASIFTGLYTRSHGAHHTFETLNPPDNDLGGPADWPLSLPLAGKFNTLAEILSQKGYSTKAIISNHGYLGPDYRLDQGFQYYSYKSPVPFLGRYFGNACPLYLRQSIHTLLARLTSPSDYDMAYRRADGINEEVFALLDKTDKQRDRFFMFINYMDAHVPYDPPPPYDMLFPGKDETFSAARYAAMEEQVMKLERKVTDKERRHIVSQYDGGIAYMDFNIGKLISQLKKAGFYENSLIIITSDHGEAFGERSFVQHGTSVYQDQVHVPLIIKYPNIRQQRVINKFVSGVDLMPTVLDVLGYGIPDDVQGSSLLKPDVLDNRTIISESFSTRKKLRWHKRFYRIERAIFSGPLKFITSTSGKRELYDLSKDPGEEKNVYGTDVGASGRLDARLDRWLEVVREESPSLEESSSHQKLDKGALQRLKALGYIQ